MEDALRNMQQQLLEMQQRLATSEQTSQGLMQRLTASEQQSQAIGQLAGAVEKFAETSGQKQTQSLVDTRGVGRPSAWGSGEEKVLEKTFPTFIRKVENYIISVFSDFRPVLEWATEQQEKITPAKMTDAFGVGADEIDKIMDLENKVHQLYSLLVQITEQEANDLVCNAHGNDLEAWRKLSRRYDPLTGRRIRNLLRSIIS